MRKFVVVDNGDYLHARCTFNTTEEDRIIRIGNRFISLAYEDKYSHCNKIFHSQQYLADIYVANIYFSSLGLFVSNIIINILGTFVKYFRCGCNSSVDL